MHILLLGVDNAFMDSDRTNVERLIEDTTFRNWVLRTNQADFEKWDLLLHRDAHLREIAEEAKAIVLMAELAEDAISPSENEQALARLRNEMEDHDKTIPVQDYAGYADRVQQRSWRRYAAVILLLILVGTGAGCYVAAVHFLKGAEVRRAEVQHSTQKGQFLTLNLPDGSKVKLNANSTIHIADDFLRDRSVKLRGEAFFDVARNEALPFKVITEKFSVEVLGTSFNINSYQGRPAKVLVKTGKVHVQAVGDSTDNVILTKHQAALFDKTQNRLRATEFDEDEFLWKDGILVFKNESLESIAEKLEAWYGITITISNPKKIKERFTGTYEKERLENVLKGLGYVLNFSYDLNSAQKKVTIHLN